MGTVRKRLTDQLRQAGIFEIGSNFPLAGDPAMHVITAMSLAMGSDYLRCRFVDLAVLFEKKYGWDGSFDGMAWVLQEDEENSQEMDADHYLDGLYETYVVPFLLLDRYRRTEEEYADRIAEIRAENERLRQALRPERTMKDGEP